MNNKQNDVVLEFPRDGGHAFTVMSLRDWFAGMALQGLATGMPDYHKSNPAESYAGGAYQLADAMLVARKQAVEEPSEPEWIEWNGAEHYPFGVDDIGDVKFRDGDVSMNQRLAQHDWRILGTGNDIIAYRIGGGK